MDEWQQAADAWYQAMDELNAAQRKLNISHSPKDVTAVNEAQDKVDATAQKWRGTQPPGISKKRLCECLRQAGYANSAEMIE